MHLYLLGYPLGHSLSPRIHNAALQAVNLTDWRYDLLPVPPADLAAAMQRLRQPNCVGGNVTIPHKQAVIPYLDALTPAAEAIGAVNTIFVREGRRWGDNTDAAGFWEALQQAFGALPPRQAVVLGAGGAARAAGYALATRGWALTFVARRLAQAAALARAARGWGSPAAHAVPWDALAAVSWQPADDALVVNCTPVGMAPHPEGDPWPEALPLPPRGAVYDMVYNPRPTRLVQRARAAGLPTADGLGMLVAQAALAFTRWTGRPAPHEVMWQAVR